MTFNPQILAFAFISPLFFWAGAGLVALPILIHLLNRRRFRTVHWAAMDFLLKAMKKNRKRLRFEQLLLLCTRCLVLLLLGLALARPMGCSDTSLAGLAGKRSGLHVLVINNAYSMAYQADRAGARTHLDQAKIIAKAIIERLSAGGESVAIVTAGRPAKAVIATPVYDLRAAEAAVDRIPQSYDGTDEAGALGLALDIGRGDHSQIAKRLYLIDDSTRIGWTSNPDSIKQSSSELATTYVSGIEHFNLGKPGQWNHAVVDLQPGSSLVTNYFSVDVAADVRGYGPCPADPKMTWKLDDTVLPPGAVDAKAGQESSPTVHTFSGLNGGIHVITAALIGDDRLNVDDSRYRVVNVVSQLKVLIVEGERGIGGLGSSGAFLDTALNPKMASDSSGKSSGYVATERISDLELSGKVLSDYRCVCLCGVGQIQEQQAAQLETYVRQGGTVMIFMGDPVSAENYNATLLKHHLLPGPLIKRVQQSGGQPPRRFAFNPKGQLHPILINFRGVEDSGMEAAEIYSYWQITLAADSKAERVLDFQPPADSPGDSPDPAITIHSLGRGRCIFYASAADPNSEWANLMAHQAFVPLMHSLLLGSVNGGDDWMNISVGQPVAIPPYVKFTSEPTLHDAAQADYPLEQITTSDGQLTYQSKPLEKPGLYTLATGEDRFKIAVNVPGDGADIRTIDDDAVKQAMGGINVEMLGDSVPAEAASLDQGKDLGWGVMFAVLALAAFECFIAMQFGHSRRK